MLGEGQDVGWRLPQNIPAVVDRTARRGIFSSPIKCLRGTVTVRPQIDARALPRDVTGRGELESGGIQESGDEREEGTGDSAAARGFFFLKKEVQVMITGLNLIPPLPPPPFSTRSGTAVGRSWFP